MKNLKILKKIMSKDMILYSIFMISSIVSVLLFAADYFLFGATKLSEVVIIVATILWVFSVMIYVVNYMEVYKNRLGLLSWILYDWKSDSKKEIFKNILGILMVIISSVIPLVYSYFFAVENTIVYVITMNWFTLTGLLIVFVFAIVIIIMIRPFVVVYYIVFMSPKNLVQNAELSKFFGLDKTHALVTGLALPWVAKILMWRGSAADMLKLWDAYHDEFLQYGSKQFFLKLEEKMQKEKKQSLVFYVGRNRLLRFLRYSIGVSVDEQVDFGFVKNEYSDVIQSIFDKWIKFMTDEKVGLAAKVFNPVARDIYFQLSDLLRMSKSKSVDIIYDLLKADQEKIVSEIVEIRNDITNMKNVTGAYGETSIETELKKDFTAVMPHELEVKKKSLQKVLDGLKEEVLVKEKKLEIKNQLEKALTIDPFSYSKKIHAPLSKEDVMEIINENFISFIDNFDLSVLVGFDNKKSKYIYDSECIGELLIYMFNFLVRSRDVSLKIQIIELIIEIHFNLWSYKLETLNNVISNVWKKWIDLDRVVFLFLMREIEKKG